MKKTFFLITLMMSLTANSVDVVDPNNPKYVKSLEKLSRVVQLMIKAEDELMAIYNLNALPGYLPEREIGRLQDIRARANTILNPEKRRLMLTPLILDGAYSKRRLEDLPIKED